MHPFYHSPHVVFYHQSSIATLLFYHTLRQKEIFLPQMAIPSLFQSAKASSTSMDFTGLVLRSLHLFQVNEKKSVDHALFSRPFIGSNLTFFKISIYWILFNANDNIYPLLAALNNERSRGIKKSSRA
jgi:hypothetical protein